MTPIYTPEWIKTATKDVVVAINSVLSVIPTEARVQMFKRIPPGALTGAVEGAILKNAPKELVGVEVLTPVKEAVKAAPVPEKKVEAPAPVIPPDPGPSIDELAAIRAAMDQRSVRIGQAAEMVGLSIEEVTALINASGDIEIVKPGWLRKKGA